MTDDIRKLIETLEANGQLDTADAMESQQARIELLEFELKVKSEFLSSRQCPDHSGKWQRGDCLQCRIEQLEHDFELATKLRDEAVSDLYAVNNRIELLEKVLEAANPFVQIPEIRESHISALALAIADCDG